MTIYETVTQLSKLCGETLTSTWYFRNFFMHQYSGSPGFVHGLATPVVSLALYHESTDSTPIRRGYSGENYLSAVTECSDCKRKIKMDL